MITWSEHQKPNKDTRYDHVIGETPFGRFVIAWRGWKEHDTFDVVNIPWEKETPELQIPFYNLTDAKQACELACKQLSSVAASTQKLVTQVPELTQTIQKQASGGGGATISRSPGDGGFPRNWSPKFYGPCTITIGHTGSAGTYPGILNAEPQAPSDALQDRSRVGAMTNMYITDDDTPSIVEHYVQNREEMKVESLEAWEALTAQNFGQDVITPLIREVFLDNGFTIKQGCDDLKPYVYTAAKQLLMRYNELTLTDPILHLEDLISQYWDIAYQEGAQGRQTDTPDGRAGLKWLEIQRAIRVMAKDSKSKT